MKILHTADWHMNDTLGRVDRSGDICRSLERIAAYLEEHRVDVMVVAGDLFDRSRPDQMRQAVSEIKRIFQPFLHRGGTILAIAGNHDSEILFETLRDALDLVAPGRSNPESPHATGRLYLAPNPGVVTLADAKGTRVQFALMPYPTARCYIRDPQKAGYTNIEEKHRFVQAAFVETLNHLRDNVIQAELPSVLVSHVHVRGTDPHALYRISELEDVVFEASDIPASWAYVAYGHIHKGQTALPNSPHIRYSGSIERMDAGERNDDKGVVLVEIGPQGRIGEPAVLPLQGSRIIDVVIQDPDVDIARLPGIYPDAADALVKYTMHWRPGVHNRDRLCAAINEIFPRWYGRETPELGLGAAGEMSEGPVLTDMIGTVRQYLGTQLKSSRQRQELIALAEAIMAEDVAP